MAHGRVRNLGFVKNPHFAGSLRYDSPHLPGSGCFHVHRIGEVTLTGLLRALLRLARGRFAGGRGRTTTTPRPTTGPSSGESAMAPEPSTPRASTDSSSSSRRRPARS